MQHLEYIYEINCNNLNTKIVCYEHKKRSTASQYTIPINPYEPESLQTTSKIHYTFSE